MAAEIILEDVHFSFANLPVLDGISLAVEKGSLTALTGPNGAGKSTLLKLMAGALKPSHGRVTAPKALAYLPQISTLPRNFPLLVRQIVASGFWPLLGETKAITPALLGQVDAALEQVGLAGFGARQLGELSGGQFQRVLLARVIVQDAAVILLDEPFTAVDAAGQALLMSIVQSWHKAGRTIVCVSHDPQLVQANFPQLIACDQGQVWHGPTNAAPANLQGRMFA